MRLFDRLPRWESTTANHITLTRLAIGLVGIYFFYWWMRMPEAAFALFAISAAMDGVDGWYARTFERPSKFGQFLDPLADKITCISALLAVSHHYGYPRWCVIPLIVFTAYDLMTLLMRIFDEEMKTSLIAKFKQWVVFLGIGSILHSIILDEDVVRNSWPSFPPTDAHFAFLGACMLWGATILVGLSAIRYLKESSVSWIRSARATLYNALRTII